MIAEAHLQHNDQMHRMHHDQRVARLCEIVTWRIERLAGEEEGYLLSLLCADGHVHFLARTPLYAELRGIMREWERETWGVEIGYPVRDCEEL